VPFLNNFKKNFSQNAAVIVVFMNLQCALNFLLTPSQFAPAFELSGIPGDVAIRGFAILFIMWNVPYVFALINPIKYKISYLEAIFMQAIGLIGEYLLTQSIPAIHTVLQDSIQRFIIFDGIGLILLIAGFWSIPDKKT
jgi:hypothetical protein